MIQRGQRLIGEHIREIPDPPEDRFRRYEILDGQLFASLTPIRMHQHVLGNLLVPLNDFVRSHQVGEIIMGPIGVMLTEYDAVQPDIVFVSTARCQILSRRAVEGVPDLVVEILSPSTRSRDRGIKLRQYQAAGVPYYWIADPRARTIEERILGEDGYGPPTVYGVGDLFQPALFPGLTIEVARLWT